LRKELGSTVPILPDWAIQTLQVITILVLAPLIAALSLVPVLR
jgi:hypothetical protein